MAGTFVSQFTPSLLTSAELERIFVQQSRRELAGRIVELMRESVLTEAKHQVLVSGPRGIGKTHLVSIVHSRLSQMHELDGRALFAWLREEEWGVSSFLDLVLRIFRALTPACGQEGDLPENTAVRIEALYGMSAQEAEVAAADLLAEITSERTLVVIAENLEDLFTGLGADGQMRLRAYLQEHPQVSILATTPCLFEAIEKREQPFFGFFRTYELDELLHEEAVDLLSRVADLKGDLELAEFIRTPTGRARVRAIGHLAGGNHRIYITLSEIVNRASLDALADAVLEMLDRLTPYYQSRMKQLSAQQCKLVEFLCERRGATPVREIATRCFVTQQVASAQLSKLRESGYVVSTSEGRESYYEIREPLMRLSLDVKKNRGEPIRLFVEFLRIWYSREELVRKLEALPAGARERRYLERALELTREEAADPVIRACEDALARFRRSGDDVQALEVAIELAEYRGSPWDWFILGAEHARVDRAESDAAYKRALAAKSVDDRDRAIRIIVLFLLDRRSEAIEELQECTQGDSLDAAARYWFVWAASILEEWEEVVRLTQDETDIGLAANTGDRAVALVALGRFDEGLDCLRRAANIGNASVRAAVSTGELIRQLARTQVAPERWAKQARQLVAFCAKHDLLGELGEGLVCSVSELLPLARQNRLRAWVEAWSGAAYPHAQLSVPLVLLDAASRYTVSADRRVLLELAVEERTLLAPLLRVEL